MGLRAALRQDPDVVLIGEMRDAETIDTAMKAAETGHLLISTVHTPDAQSTVLRILAMFPPEEQDAVRVRLAESLYAVVSQRLLPRADGKGRVAALEIMIVTPTIRELILDKDRVGEIRDFIAEGREQYGMQTFDQHLEELVTSETVEFGVALAASTRPSDFQLKMQMLNKSPTKSGGKSGGKGGGKSGAAKEPDPGAEPITGSFGTGLEFLNG
jgi:twitching motility protein PilT